MEKKFVYENYVENLNDFKENITVTLLESMNYFNLYNSSKDMKNFTLGGDYLCLAIAMIESIEADYILYDIKNKSNNNLED